jgi:AcrR family transcriptional regulator
VLVQQLAREQHRAGGPYRVAEMPELTSTRPLRADARRSRSAILSSATALLCRQPEATLEDVAVAAGVSRQTVYSHFGSRRDLIAAVAEQATRDYLTALDGAGLDERSPLDAFGRFIEISTDWTLAAHRLPASVMAALEEHDAELAHHPVRDRITSLVRRGQRSGDFARGLSADWLATATIALAHTVAAEVAEGRLSGRTGRRVLHQSLARLYGSGV